MRSSSTGWLARGLVLFCAVLSSVGSAEAGQPRAFEGRTLVEALRALQGSGLRIVFSSEIVTSDMRVVAEPRATTPRQQLDELLAPHGLKAEPGPGSVILVVRVRPVAKKNPIVKPSEPATRGGDVIEPAPPERAGSVYAERVIVRGSPRNHEDREVASTVTLDASDLRSMQGVLDDDPLQAVHALPRVAAVDDFRSDFSVRGSPYRHIGVVVDGVAASWLQHGVYGHNDIGSLSMFGTASLERATLQAGAYPQRYGDRLGAQLELTLREGSRESNRFHGSLGGTSGAFVAEGPLGGGRRGSWIVGLRNSYLDWPVRRRAETDLAFAFADAHGKLVYDVSDTQQLSLTVLGGRSSLEGPDEPFPDMLADGMNRALLTSVGLRTTLGSRMVLRQRASFVAQEFLNTRQSGERVNQGRNDAFAYRAEVLNSLFGGRFEAGGELQQVHGSRYVPINASLSAVDGSPPPRALEGAFGAVWSAPSVYAHFNRTLGQRLSLALGARVADSTLTHDRTLARWALADWSFSPGWTLNASVGVSHQFPELEQLGNGTSAADLEAERATHIDIGLERRMAGAFRWQATVFSRVERNVLSEPYAQPRLVGGIMFDSPRFGRSENALRGTSRGVELLVARERTARLSGWVSYVYGTMLQTDTVNHETFWGDFDRRHVFNAAGLYRVSPQTTVGVVFRGTTNVPIPGYLDVRDGGLFVGERRNAVRLRHYARLDARIQRTLTSSTRQVALFGEVLNVLNRENQAPGVGLIQQPTGQAIGFTHALVPRRASAGIVVGF